MVGSFASFAYPADRPAAPAGVAFFPPAGACR